MGNRNTVKAAPPILTLITVVNVKQEMDVVPRFLEACLRPAHLAHECQVLADYHQKPVVLRGPQGDRHTFMPVKRKK